MLKIPCVGQVRGVLWEPLALWKVWKEPRGYTVQRQEHRMDVLALVRVIDASWSTGGVGLRSGALGQGARRPGGRVESPTRRLVEYA